MIQPTPPDPLLPNKQAAYEAWQAFLKAQKRWRQAFNTTTRAVDRQRAAAARLAKTDAMLDVHLFHRDLIIEESGVTQIRGTFRLARWILAVAGILTALGATLYAFGLPQPDSKPETLALVQFTKGVPVPKEGTDLVIRVRGLTGPFGDRCGFPQTMEGRLVGDLGAVTEIIVGDKENESCRGRWLLPAGSWYQVSGLPLPLEPPSTDPAASEEESDEATTGAD